MDSAEKGGKQQNEIWREKQMEGNSENPQKEEREKNTGPNREASFVSLLSLHSEKWRTGRGREAGGRGKGKARGFSPFWRENLIATVKGVDCGRAEYKSAPNTFQRAFYSTFIPLSPSLSLSHSHPHTRPPPTMPAENETTVAATTAPVEAAQEQQKEATIEATATVTATEAQKDSEATAKRTASASDSKTSSEAAPAQAETAAVAETTKDEEAPSSPAKK